MPYDSDPARARQFIQQTYRYYAALMETGPAHLGAAPRESLGGQLFWAGELDETGSALTVAANVAGAATLAATSDTNAHRHAVRDSIVDFLVNSLDEALRILKNEIRKGAAVAVCVAAPLEAIEREMTERGVQPDIFRQVVLRAAQSAGQHAIADRKSGVLDAGEGKASSDATSSPARVTWCVDHAPAVWVPKLDVLALACLRPEEKIARRWLERSGRYLGRTGHAEHLVFSDQEFAERFAQRVREAIDRGEIAIGGSIQTLAETGPDNFHFDVPKRNDAR